VDQLPDFTTVCTRKTRDPQNADLAVLLQLSVLTHLFLATFQAIDANCPTPPAFSSLLPPCRYNLDDKTIASVDCDTERSSDIHYSMKQPLLTPTLTVQVS